MRPTQRGLGSCCGEPDVRSVNVSDRTRRIGRWALLVFVALVIVWMVVVL